MGEDNINQDNLPFLFAPAIQQDLLSITVGVNPEREILLSKRADGVVRRLGTFSHLADLITWSVFFGAETAYDMHKVPENYTRFGLDLGKLATLTLDPGLKQQLDSLGDVLEVSSLHLAGRAGLAIVNELLLTKPVKNATKRIFNKATLKNVFEKFFDKETIEDYAVKGEIQLSDDARFWISLVPVLMFMAAHSLGYIDSPNPDHWHGGDPVPWMLKGQFLAASSLVAMHYVVKYPEKVGRVVKGLASGVSDSVQQLGQFMVRMSKDVGNILEKSGKDIFNVTEDGFEAVQERVMAQINDFAQMHKLAGDWFDAELKVAELMIMNRVGKKA